MAHFIYKLFSPDKKTNQLVAENVYRAMLTHSRLPDFYIRFGVPDTFDGRFEVLLLHIYLVFHRIKEHGKYKDLSQRIFDVTFKDMDQTLRQSGVGDMGIPKHMKRMMAAFNGRMHAYRAAMSLQEGDLRNQSLFEALKRNVYGTVEKPNDIMIEDMAKYVLASVDLFNQQDLQTFVLGNILFLKPSAIDSTQL